MDEPPPPQCHCDDSDDWSPLDTAMLTLALAVMLASVLGALVWRRWWLQQSAESRQKLLLSTRPPQKGELVTLVITDVQASTSLWDKYAEDMAELMQDHHSILRSLLAEYNGFELATEGDSFQIAFHRPEDAILWCCDVQVMLQNHQWPPQTVDGGQSILTDADKKTFAMEGKGYPHALHQVDDCCDPWDPHNTCIKRHNSAKARTKPQRRLSTVKLNPHAHTPEPLAPREFLGLRVRMAVHTGVVEDVRVHPRTRRVQYYGDCMDVVRAMGDVPCGGQVLISGDTLAVIPSLTDLRQRLRGTEGGEAVIVHMGTHLLAKRSAPSDAPRLLLQRRSLTARPASLSDESTRRASTMHSAPAVPLTDSLRSVDLDVDAGRHGVDIRAAFNEHQGPRRDTTSGEYEQILVEEGALSTTMMIDLLTVTHGALRGRLPMFPPLRSEEQVSPAFFDCPAKGHVCLMCARHAGSTISHTTHPVSCLRSIVSMMMATAL